MGFKIRKSLSKIIAFTLAIVTTVTAIPVDALANSWVNSGFSQGSIGSTANTGGGQASYSEKEGGYRFYIVDKQMNCVSIVHDYIATDWRYNEIRYFATGTYGTAWNSAPSKGYIRQSGGKLNSFADLQAHCGASKPVPLPMAYAPSLTGFGEEFYNWFMDGVRLTNQGNIVTGTSGASGSIYVGNTNLASGAYNYDPSVLSTFSSNRGSYNLFMGAVEVSQNSEGCDPNIDGITLDEVAELKRLADAIKRGVSTAWSDRDKHLGKWIDTDGDKKGDIQITNDLYDDFIIGRCINSTINNVEGEYDENTNDYIVRDSAYKKAANIAYIIKFGVERFILDSVIKSKDGKSTMTEYRNEDILKQSIPLTGDSNASQGKVGVGPALTFLDQTGFWGLEDLGFNTAWEALKTKEYFLVVEPLTWIYVCDSSGYSKDGRVYGTPYNICQYWLQSSLPNKGPSGGYMTPVINQFVICLTVASPHDDITYNGNPLKVGQKVGKSPISTYMNLMNSASGIGLQIYGGDDFNISGTSTYDEPLESSPGKAPDDSSILTPEEKADPTRMANIVKFYEDHKVDGSIDRQNYTRENTPQKIQIETEPKTGYKLVDWFIAKQHIPATGTEDYKDYKVNKLGGVTTREGTDPELVEIQGKDGEKTLYLQYVKVNEELEYVEGTYTLSESRLSRFAETEETDDGNDLLAGGFNIVIPDLNGDHEYDCGGCCDSHSSDENGDPIPCGECHGHPCSLSSDDLDDDRTFIVMTNTARDESLISPKEGKDWGDFWEGPSGNGEEFIRTSLNSSTEHVEGYNYQFIIHRAAKDKAKLYDGSVQNPISGAAVNPGGLANLNFEAVNKGIARVNGGKIFNLSIPINLEEHGKNGSDTYTDASCEHGKHEDGDNSMSTYTPPIDVAINTYGGTPNGGMNDSSVNTAEVLSIPLSGYNNVTGRMIQQSGKSFNFYPYIMMQYDNLVEKDKLTYVTGAYQRGMTVNDYAEIAWNRTSSSNLHVTSNQWTTHAGALKLIADFEDSSFNKILPGGAVYSLDTKGSNQIMQVNSYQTILKGKGLEQVGYNQTVPEVLKEAHATATHEAYVTTVVNTLEQLSMEQYVSTEAAQGSAFDSGIEVGVGMDISDLDNGSTTASGDDKYYFRDDAGGLNSAANEYDLDVNNKGTKVTYYTFSSDVAGNIWMKAEGAENYNKKILGQTDTIDNLNDARAQMLDARTGVVTKLLAALERNTGNDENSWAESNHWYNEAFNGITVVMYQTTLELGFHDPSIRSTVLDPKLIPQQVSKGTIFQQVFSSQFRTENKGIGMPAPNILGKFAGQRISTKNLESLFWSNKFYIPDANVQDLS